VFFISLPKLILRTCGLISLNRINCNNLLITCNPPPLGRTLGRLLLLILTLFRQAAIDNLGPPPLYLLITPVQYPLPQLPGLPVPRNPMLPLALVIRDHCHIIIINIVNLISSILQIPDHQTPSLLLLIQRCQPLLQQFHVPLTIKLLLKELNPVYVGYLLALGYIA